MYIHACLYVNMCICATCIHVYRMHTTLLIYVLTVLEYLAHDAHILPKLSFYKRQMCAHIHVHTNNTPLCQASSQPCNRPVNSAGYSPFTADSSLCSATFGRRFWTDFGRIWAIMWGPRLR